MKDVCNKNYALFFFFIGRIKMNCAECPVDPSAFRVHVGNVPLL